MRSFITPIIGGKFFVYGPDEKDKFIRDTGYEFEGDEGGLVSYADGYPRVFFEEISPQITYHEALHIAMALLERVGIEIDYDNHEILAYLQSWVAEQMNKVIAPS